MDRFAPVLNDPAENVRRGAEARAIGDLAFAHAARLAQRDGRPVAQSDYLAECRRLRERLTADA